MVRYLQANTFWDLFMVSAPYLFLSLLLETIIFLYRGKVLGSREFLYSIILNLCGFYLVIVILTFAVYEMLSGSRLVW